MEELNEHSEEVKGMIQQLITSVFNHRYRLLERICCMITTECDVKCITVEM